MKAVFQSTSFFDPSLRGTSAEFFIENKSAQKIRKPLGIDSVFRADFEYAIRFGQNSV